jgi:PAS domain S-box-containing protein
LIARRAGCNPSLVHTAEKLRLLLIDDDQGDATMTRAMIDQIDREAMSLDWVPSFEEGQDAIRRGEHDVYLVDYMLEDRDGLELVRWARAQGIRKPMIMLTGRGSHEVDVEAMRAGASDYLVKGEVDARLLERSIRYAVERARAEEALRDSEERHRGMFDHLPIGLYRSNLEGGFLEANPALLQILGYPDPETLRSVYAADWYVNPADRGRFREMLDRFGVVRGFETRLTRPDGSSVLVRNSARAHRGGDGRLRYIEGAVEEVTDAARAGGLPQGA